MFVFRVENKAGEGPYARFRVNGMRLDIDWHHPIPEDDGLYDGWFYKENWGDARYGFRSEVTWFSDKDLETLRQHGFTLKKYWAEIYDVGDNQVVFDMVTAEFVSEHTL